MTVLATPPFEAPAMRMPRIRFTVRRMMIAVAIVAPLLALLKATWVSPVPGSDDAVRIATARMASGDPGYRPEMHVARVYRECGTSPLNVDFYKVGGSYVVGKVQFSRGGVLGPLRFSESALVESSRSGGGRYLLDRTGEIVNFVRD